MEVLKMGTFHKENEINCQDAIGSYGNMLKVVCDGCSEGKHSEIGATLFCKLLIEKYANMLNKGKSQEHINVPTLMRVSMYELIKMIGNNPEDVKDYLCFTTLVAEKMKGDNCGWTYSCGDGYIVVKKDDWVSFKKLDCGAYPKYLAYDYIDSKYLSEYKDGVLIDTMRFEDIENIGVASDGIRFVADLDDNNPLKQEFSEIIMKDNSLKMKLFFNRNSKLFQDDFSIVV